VDLNKIGSTYRRARREVMKVRQEGLTEIYNRFNDRSECSVDIQQLRSLQRDLDAATAEAYDWRDLDLGHGFHETKQGLRFTISESSRLIVLDRLLALNHDRYDQEVRTGLHDNKGKGGGRKRTPRKKLEVSTAQGGLYSEG
jgi:hypothetical protein